jgi:filamentous hemagglutinin
MADDRHQQLIDRDEALNEGDSEKAGQIDGDIATESLLSLSIPAGAGAVGKVVDTAEDVVDAAEDAAGAAGDLAKVDNAVDDVSAGGNNLGTEGSIGSDEPYNSQNVRGQLEETYGVESVASTTVPPLNKPNVKLAGQRHPVTGVVFDNKGYPIFDDIAGYDTRININDFRSASYTQQMQMASQDLAQAIRNGQVSSNQFTPQQLNQLNSGLSKIDGYTWHHHQDTGRMQLVPEFEHSKTGHVGWESMQQGR